jgi:hypothetical protein
VLIKLIWLIELTELIKLSLKPTVGLTSEPQNIEYPTAEYRISNRRILKDGYASLSLF